MSTAAPPRFGREVGAGLRRRLVLPLGALAAAERPRLALWLPVAMGAGVAWYFALAAEPPLWAGTAGFVLALALAVAGRVARIGPVAIALAAVAAGFAAAQWRTAAMPPAIRELPFGAVVAEGTVVAMDVLAEGRRVRLAEVRLGEVGPVLTRDIRLRLASGDATPLAPGDRVRLRTLVRPPAPPAAPGAFDFQRVAFFGRLGAVGFALGPAEVVRPAAASSVALALARLRQAVVARTLAAVPGTAGAVAAALLTGQRAAIPEHELARIRDSGLAHLLSVSGLHVGIVAALGFLAVRLALGLWPWALLHLHVKKIAAIAGIALGLGYMLLTGSEVPMQRAIAMAALVALAVVLDRSGVGLRALALAACVVLLLQPEAVLGPSFQMSFAAVLALIAAWEGVRGTWLAPRRDRTWLARAGWGVAALAFTSLVASAATAPFGAFHFQRVQVYGIAANALAVPVASVWVMPWGMAALLLMPFGLEVVALAPMAVGIEAILAVAREVASWPGAAPGLPAMPGLGLAACAFGLCWLCLWRTRLRLAGVPVLAIGLASPWLVRPPDILVAPDARLIAIRAEDALHVQSLQGASRFVRAIWTERSGGLPMRPLPARGRPAAAIDCAPDACMIGEAGRAAAVLLRGDPPWRWCGRVAAVVSAEPVRARCAGSVVVDRFSVWRDGAHAVWLDRDDARVVSDRGHRGARPWVPPPPRTRAEREADALPRAPLDEEAGRFR
ncbi:ComEC/Rec2 family competence protein [Elioraea sp.]|jgi:competence protein ComEC|uniref:ComEC/Rec2 family competence protein n=1 Tax=Elioraea sp. TaxID=2185103 RepID=UPI0021DCC614|nr:ComEC/Rec2 family competence protein [Elioraea sp.]GIX11674.1 MAG: competence protein ComEC [Elioraea sp.]